MTPDEINGTRLFVLQRAIAALIVTHPDPAAFAKAFGLVNGMQQLDQIAYAKANPAVREESKVFSQELIDLANDEVERRKADSRRMPPAG